MGDERLGVRYELSQKAYIKLVLHSLKHPYSAVNGVILGRATSDPSVISIVDSVPLFHSNLALLPPLEISLLMIEEHCANAEEGLGIVGYFHANERMDDSELGMVAKNIGDHIARYFPLAPVLLLDSKKLDSLKRDKSTAPVLKLYTKDAYKNWKAAGSDGGAKLVLSQPAANSILLDCMATEKWSQVVDFDEHLDDITKDWSNSGLFN